MGCGSSSYRLKVIWHKDVHFIQVWKNNKRIPISQLKFVLQTMQLKKYTRKFYIIGSSRISNRQRDRDRTMYSSAPSLIIRGLKHSRVSTFSWDFIHKIHETIGSSCTSPEFSVNLPPVY